MTRVIGLSRLVRWRGAAVVPPAETGENAHALLLRCWNRRGGRDGRRTALAPGSVDGEHLVRTVGDSSGVGGCWWHGGHGKLSGRGRVLPAWSYSLSSAPSGHCQEEHPYWDWVIAGQSMKT